MHQNFKYFNKITDVFALVVLIIIAISCLYLFHYLNSQEVDDYIVKVNSASSTAGFRLLVVFGFLKMITFVLGLFIPIALIIKFFHKIRRK